MRCQRAGVKSGDDAQPRSLAALLVDDVLRVIEAAAALRLAPQPRVGGLGVGAPARAASRTSFSVRRLQTQTIMVII